MIVKSSLALSLGLVGALSIVRFRAAIKEPEELVYLFLIIAAGLGCGAGQLKITIVGILFSLLIIFIYSFVLKRKKIKNIDSLNLAIIINENISDSDIEKIIEDIKKISIELNFISMSSLCGPIKDVPWEISNVLDFIKFSFIKLSSCSRFKLLIFDCGSEILGLYEISISSPPDNFE